MLAPDKQANLYRSTALSKDNSRLMIGFILARPQACVNIILEVIEESEGMKPKSWLTAFTCRHLADGLADYFA
jgi:hypothetical protein